MTPQVTRYTIHHQQESYKGKFMKTKNEKMFTEYLKKIIHQAYNSKTEKEIEGDICCFKDFVNLRDDYEVNIYERLSNQSVAKTTDEPSEIILLNRWMTSDEKLIPFSAVFRNENDAIFWTLCYLIELDDILVRFRCTLKNGIFCTDELFVNSIGSDEYEGEVDLFSVYLKDKTIH